MKNLLKNIFMSFVVALIPTFVSLVLYIGKFNNNASFISVILWLILFLIIFTIIILIFRLSSTESFLKKLGLCLVIPIIIYMGFMIITTVFICTKVNGNFSMFLFPDTYDIRGRFVTNGTGRTMSMSSICYVPKEKVPDLLLKKSFFYENIYFVVDK